MELSNTQAEVKTMIEEAGTGVGLEIGKTEFADFFYCNAWVPCITHIVIAIYHGNIGDSNFQANTCMDTPQEFSRMGFFARQLEYHGP
jgi:hypothetical protein